MSYITPSATKTVAGGGGVNLSGMAMFDEIPAGPLSHGNRLTNSVMVPGAYLYNATYNGGNTFKNRGSIIVFIDNDFIPANQLTGQSYVYDKPNGILTFNTDLVEPQLLTIYVSDGNGVGGGGTGTTGGGSQLGTF